MEYYTSDIRLGVIFLLVIYYYSVSSTLRLTHKWVPKLKYQSMTDRKEKNFNVYIQSWLSSNLKATWDLDLKIRLMSQKVHKDWFKTKYKMFKVYDLECFCPCWLFLKMLTKKMIWSLVLQTVPRCVRQQIFNLIRHRRFNSVVENCSIRPKWSSHGGVINSRRGTLKCLVSLSSCK